ncbi:MAG: hypothetical protein Q8904_14690 [Bacteroidota bacterium]|nr:hypothetical protein [Bacteroidota bacterium]
MTKRRKLIPVFTLLLIGFGIMFTSGCKSDPEVKSTTYDLKTTDILGVSGTVTFIETSATAATINIVSVSHVGQFWSIGYCLV